MPTVPISPEKGNDCSPLLSILSRCEIWILLALFVMLPWYEAPKNLLCIAYVIIAGWRLIRERRLAPFDAWDGLLALWFVSIVLSATFAGLPGKTWGGPTDALRYLSVVFLIRRAGYSSAQLRTLFLAAAFAVLPALLQAYGELLVTHQRALLELHSVGHINHTAIYLAIALGAAGAGAAYGWITHASWRYAASILTSFIGVSLLFTASRGAIAAGVLAVIMMALLAVWPQSDALPKIRRHLRVGCALLLVAATLGYFAIEALGGQRFMASGGLGGKFVQDQQQGETFSYRDKLWQTAWVTGEHFPWFGVGTDNFGAVTPTEVCNWSGQTLPACDTHRFYFAGHAHSLFFNTLAERGLFGLGVLLLALASWAVSLWRGRSAIQTQPATLADPLLAAGIWNASFAALVVTVGAGLLNTSLHHEHGMLATLLLALWLAVYHPLSTRHVA